jgi:hypothetical protein
MQGRLWMVVLGAFTGQKEEEDLKEVELLGLASGYGLLGSRLRWLGHSGRSAERMEVCVEQNSHLLVPVPSARLRHCRVPQSMHLGNATIVSGKLAQQC